MPTPQIHTAVINNYFEVFNMNNLDIFADAGWIVPQESALLNPINIYHKEIDRVSVELPVELKNKHILYRKEIEIKKSSEEVFKIRITADDYYKLYINGKFVCQGPAQGYYWHYNWNEFDITDFLLDGNNIFEIQVYYQGLINRAFNSGDRRLG